MKALLMTNEYPPYTYGGAGVHVEYLSRELSKLIPVEVRAFGDQNVPDQNPSVFGTKAAISGYTCPKSLSGVFDAAQRSLSFNTMNIDADVVHCHTWYTHLGGIIAKLNYGIPLVITVHSLEPLRPWKREQLMADAVVAVSEGTRNDILKLFNVDPAKVHIIYNGIDTNEYQKKDATPALSRYRIDPAKPYVLFVGRITRQKGIVYLANAIRYMDPGYQVVLCAGAPDTPEIAAEMKAAVKEASKGRDGIFWIDEMVNKETVIQLYSGAAVFCCPSIYEPFGIINLEAMACETPVVGSSVGGIPEVIVHDETGYLVPVAQSSKSPFEPLNPDAFSNDLARKINRLMANPELREAFGKAGRKRAVETFSWETIARQTSDLYASFK